MRIFIYPNFLRPPHVVVYSFLTRALTGSLRHSSVLLHTWLQVVISTTNSGRHRACVFLHRRADSSSTLLSVCLFDSRLTSVHRRDWVDLIPGVTSSHAKILNTLTIFKKISRSDIAKHVYRLACAAILSNVD